MKVVIDTNVLVSAALRDRDPETVILFVASNPDFEWVVSTEILDEYNAVLARPKFNLPEDILQRWQAVLQTATRRIEVDNTLTLSFPRDQADAKFLTCALIAEADFLVTGDRDFTEAKKVVGTIILSVSLFKTLWIDSLAEGNAQP